MIINYPDAFPCPTWAYGTDTTPYPLRTQFDNGWTRQRRAFPQTGMSANLTFKCDTVMWEKLQTWFAANGWNWFRIPLDNGDGTILEEVRLITPPTWGYDAYDNVVAQCTVEVSPDDTCREGDPLCKVYECDAIETTLLGISNIASAWRWLDLNEVGVNDRTSQEELTGLGANQEAVGGDSSLYPNPIDYCLPADDALASTPLVGAGVSFHANTILGNSEFWENHTFHAWVVMNFNSATALPVYALLNHQGSQEYVRLYIVNSTGELRFHFFDLVIGNHNSVSLGNVMTPFASGGEGKWVSLYSHFEVTPTGMAGWVEVDGVRTEVTDNTVNVKLTNSGDPRAGLLTDEGGRATPGLGALYPSFFTGEASTSDMALLDDAWDQNKTSYVDPNCAEAN